jgi:DUF1680 family protein
MHKGLPVAGYTDQTADKVDLVNGHKRIEENVLRMMDAYREDASIDQRWLAIARTQIEQGFMALNRAIFRPQRVTLPEDA